MWMAKLASTALVLVAITGLNFCIALPHPQSSPLASIGRTSTQLNGNAVIAQHNPPANPKKRGTYGPITKDPTNAWLKTIVAVLAASGTISILKEHQHFKFPFLNGGVGVFDWTQPIGALLSSALVYAVIYSVAFHIIPFFDGLRGVDRSRRHGRILKQSPIYSMLNLKAPSPSVGLAFALAFTAMALYGLENWSKVNTFFTTSTLAGCIILGATAIPVFITCLLLLPVDIPDPEKYLPEDDPSKMRILWRYCLLPIYPIVKVVLVIALHLKYLCRLATTHTAFDKVGTFRMDVSSKDTVGKPLGFTLAENIMDSSDRTLSRLRVLLNKNLENWRKWLLRKPIPRDDVKVPSDVEVWSMCSKTVLAYNVMDHIDGEHKLGGSETCLDMTPMQFFITLPNYHYNVARVYLKSTKHDKEGIATEGVATRIVMNDGKEIKKGDPEWDIAKLHFVATANLFFPAMQHNWVHFHFVDGATAMAHSLFSRGSLLHRITQPFILSNVHTNANGLGGVVVDSDPSFLNYNVDINPTSNDYFVNSIRHRSLAFYTGKSDYVLSNDVLNERVSFGFPPIFKSIDKVPYIACLQKSYEAYQVFARKVVDIISEDSEALITFQHWCNEVVVRTSDTLLAANVDHVDILATLMWQVSLLHSLDHNGYFYRFEPMNGYSGAMCDYKAHDSRRNMYTADMVRIYREFIQVAGKYFPGEPNDSLAGVREIYGKIPRSQCPRGDELETAIEDLTQKVNENLERYINDESLRREAPPHGLTSEMIGSAILT